MKNKYVFLGEDISINLEIIAKSHNFIKKKVRYLLIGNYSSAVKYLNKINYNIEIKKVTNPLDFHLLDIDKLNILDIYDTNKSKSDNLIKQLQFSDFLANLTGNDLITMPINKSIIKKNIEFNGITEFLGQINKTKTLMLMTGEKFSIIPITTHVPLTEVTTNLKQKLNNFYKSFIEIKNSSNNLKKFNKYIFLCINPHCSENDILGSEDKVFRSFANKFKNINKKIMSGDSAFNEIGEKYLFFSMYHDQALIPFKILNKKSFNFTIGLKYRRLSPSHGTAEDIIFKNKSNNTSYLQCMLD